MEHSGFDVDFAVRERRQVSAEALFGVGEMHGAAEQRRIDGIGALDPDPRRERRDRDWLQLSQGRRRRCGVAARGCGRCDDARGAAEEPAKEARHLRQRVARLLRDRLLLHASRLGAQKVLARRARGDGRGSLERSLAFDGREREGLEPRRLANLVARVRCEKERHACSAEVSLPETLTRFRQNLRVCVQIAHALDVHHHQVPLRVLISKVTEGLRRRAMQFVLDVAAV
mmetsp:Transcript_29521/g.96141  ORF Transcript_29521/g.96141 Transcript_29521/m.96141 type:complete len:229 (+) Transcript_29521:555-1241(+)